MNLGLVAPGFILLVAPAFVDAQPSSRTHRIGYLSLLLRADHIVE